MLQLLKAPKTQQNENKHPSITVHEQYISLSYLVYHCLCACTHSQAMGVIRNQTCPPPPTTSQSLRHVTLNPIPSNLIY